MTENLISIRIATIEDVDALTDLHYVSFTPEEHVPVMLGKPYVRATYVWQTTGKHSYVLVAEELGKIVGLVAVCDGPFTRPMFMACLPEFLRSLITHPNLIFKKKLWSRLFRRPDISAGSKKIADYPGFAQMTIGVVDGNCRGKGVFPLLVAETKVHSKVRASRAIRAGIYKTNVPSRRVFIKGEWIETKELETSDTVFYVAYLDPLFMKEIGIQQTEKRIGISKHLPGPVDSWNGRQSEPEPAADRPCLASPSASVIAATLRVHRSVDGTGGARAPSGTSG